MTPNERSAEKKIETLSCSEPIYEELINILREILKVGVFY